MHKALLCFYNPHIIINSIYVKSTHDITFLIPQLNVMFHGKHDNNIFILNYNNDTAILKKESINNKKIPSLKGHWTKSNIFFRIILK
jgi:hypothetical protein